MSRFSRISMVVLIGLVVVAGVCAQEPYRVGVLRGPTAVAFAPLIEDAPRLGGDQVLEIVTYSTPPNLISAYLAGEVDAATLPSNAAAQLFGRGAPVEVASTFIWGVLYLVGPKGVEIHDLSGPVHSIGRGATPDVVFRYVLEEEGLTNAIAVEYGFAQVELSQLLIAGRVSAGVLPEPFVTRVLAENDTLGVVADLQKLFEEHAGVGMPQTVLVTRPADRNAHAVVALLEESVERVLADPEAAGALVSDLGLGLDRETVVSSLPRLNLRVETAAESEPALRSYLRILHEFEPASVGGSLPADEFYGE
ncbi:MAG: ABC transporter substrate-binding protein [Spirochaetota bacterium]